MISEGQIKAKIDSKQQTIAFIDSQSLGRTEGRKVDDTQYDQEYLSVIEELEEQNKRILKLMSIAVQVDSSIKQSPEFIKKTMFKDVRISINV